jgi:acetylornithine deacetylase/succinyl-diaminopimelate desuccinylase-like protein
MVNGGAKSNSIPESIKLTCDVRTLPHQDDSYLRQELEKVIGGIPGVSYDVDYMAVPNSSPFDTTFARSIKSAAATALNLDNVQIVPSISTGFTDSRFTRPLGITTYGFSGSHPDDDPTLTRAHGTDESIGIKSLMNSSRVMLSLAYQMLAAT